MKVNKTKWLFFQPEFSNLVGNQQYGSYEKIQTFSSISLKVWLLGQKYTWTRVVNTSSLQFPYMEDRRYSSLNDLDALVRKKPFLQVK